MKRRLGSAALFLAMALLFLVANRGAYEGYFQGDDINNLAWTRDIRPAAFIPALVAPRFYEHNFRPVGHLFYSAMARTAGLRYGWYVAALHAVHLLNVLLLWLVLRRLRLGFWPAIAGALFFAFHMAVFDAYWKPMYIFDVLCACFCLMSLLAYMHRRWVLSFLCLWLAYKSKELAVMLPAALAAYEYWLGERRWRRLVPFFAVSLLFGVQALLQNPHTNDDYTLRMSPDVIRKTISFYSSLLLLVPYAGLAVLALPVLVKDRRLYFGLAWLVLLLGPMLLLPGRLFGAYLYAPLAGAAIVFAAVVAQGHTARAAAITAAFFAFWIPCNYARLRTNRRAALTEAYENRAYVETVGALARNFPAGKAFVYDGLPSGLHSWGVEGALRYFYRRREPELYAADDPRIETAFRAGPFAVLNWDPAYRKLIVLPRMSAAPDAAYLRIAANREMPIWQLGEGWYPWEWSFRWIRPRATARLFRPAGERPFELVAHIGPDQVRELGHVIVHVSLNGRLVGSHEFETPGVQTIRWKAPAGTPGPVEVEFRVEPVYHPANDPRPLGIPIAAFGFREDSP